MLESDPAITPAVAIGPFMDHLDTALASRGIGIVHLKVFTLSGAGWLKAAICTHGEEPRLEGNLDASPANRHEVLVNIRAKGEPRHVREIVAKQLGLLPGKVVNVHMECFSPAAPHPERIITTARG